MPNENVAIQKTIFICVLCVCDTWLSGRNLRKFLEKRIFDWNPRNWSPYNVKAFPTFLGQPMRENKKLNVESPNHTYGSWSTRTIFAYDRFVVEIQRCRYIAFTVTYTQVRETKTNIFYSRWKIFSEKNVRSWEI